MLPCFLKLIQLCKCKCLFCRTQLKFKHLISLYGLPLYDLLGCLLALSLIVYLFLSWIFARKWPNVLQGGQLGIICRFLSLSAWMVVISPVAVLIMWGSWLIVILGRDIIGLAIIMAGTALLLAFYSIMLWWRTQWQSSSMHFLELHITQQMKIYYIFLLGKVIKLCLFKVLLNC